MRLGRRGAGTISRAATAVATLCVITLLVTSCESDGDSEIATPARTTSTSASASTESTTSTTAASSSDPDADVIASYAAFWSARAEANNPPNPDSAALRRTATGEQLATATAEAKKNLADGLAIRPGTQPPRARVKVTTRTEDTATVQECVVDDATVVRASTGEVVDDRVATHSVDGTLVKVDGVWKVSAVRLVQRWEGVAGCALAEGL